MPPTTLEMPRRAGPAERPERRSGLFLAVILAAQLMVVLDTTIVNVALPHIQGGLGFSGSGLSWVLNAYILTFGGLLLLGARAGDLTGRRLAYPQALFHFSRGELDAFYFSLNRAIDDRFPELLYVGVDPVFAGERQRPRFQAALRRLGL